MNDYYKVIRSVFAVCIVSSLFLINSKEVFADQPSFTGLNAEYCSTDAPVTLTGSEAPAGTFSGPGITDNGNGTATFNPATAGTGGTVTYTVIEDHDWASISAGTYHTLAIKTDGTLWAWGFNLYGQLGIGSTTNQSSPVQVGTDTDWAIVSADGDHTLAIKTDGTLWAWGRNLYGQLGIGSSTNQSSPVQVGSASDWANVSCGIFHTVALKTDGTLWAWGRNLFGQLGIGSTINQSSPVQVGSATDWANVSGGGYHTVALKMDGTLWAWGENSIGQLGIGNNTDQINPVQVGTAFNWSLIATGELHTLAIKSNGTLWAWGYNSFGQLGIGNNTDQNNPVQVGTGNDWAIVSAGSNHTLAVKNNGTLWAWGRNIFGQLGIGNTIAQNSPVQVGTATNWGSIATGESHTIALKTDGTLWAWGNNGFGQLGLGNTFNQNSPALVGTAFTSSQTVTVHAPPIAGITNITGSTILTCTTTSISLTATGGGTYAWSNGLGTNAAVSVSTAGTYTVTVTGTGGCTATASVTITSDGTNVFTSGIVYVNDDASGLSNGSNWTDAFTDLQSALMVANICSNITQIWVAAGIYKPTTDSNRSIAFNMKNNLAIYGGFEGIEPPGYNLNLRNFEVNTSTLSGEIGDPASGDNSFHVVSNIDLTASAVLDGFTISDGSANVCVDTNCLGGGMYNGNSSPTIVNCIFTNNFGVNGGAMYNGGSAPEIVNCSFLGNHSSIGGAMSQAGNTANPSVFNSVFIGNRANEGGAIANQFGGSINVVNCSFSGNLGDQAYAQFATLVQNGITGLLTIKNSIIWGNSGGVSTINGGSADVNHSIVQGNFPGIGNLDTNPFFIMQPATIGLGTSGDLRLHFCSMAIDAGDGPANPKLIDRDGNNRNFDAIAGGTLIDMGAYEYQFIPFTIEDYTVTGGGSFCFGGSGVPVGLSGSQIGVNYQLKSGVANFGTPVEGTGAAISFGNLTIPETYTVAAFYGNTPCSLIMSGSATVIMNLPPTASITNNTGISMLTCTTTSISLTATGGGTYVWSNGLGTDATVSVNTAGTYTVTVTGTNGCTTSASVSITGNSTLPTAGITNNTGTSVLTCTITNISLTATGGGTYAWSNGLGTDATVSVNTAGTYMVTVTGTNGCTTSASVSITGSSTPPTAGITNNTGSTVLSCTITNISLTATGGGTYAWSNGLGTNATVSVNSAGTYTVTVTGTNGCTTSASVSITGNSTLPTAGITNNTGTTVLNCTTTSISLTATGGGTYAWSNGLGTDASVSVNTAGTYTVTVTGANGCTASASIVITAIVPFTSCNDGNPSTINDMYDADCNCVGTPSLLCNPGASLGGEITFCAGGVIGLIATGGNQYQWSGPNGYVSTSGSVTRSNATVNMSGTYTVTITNNDCVDILSIVITVYPKPSATLSGISPVCSGGTITLTAPAGGASYQWSGPAGFTDNTGSSNTLIRLNVNTTMSGQYKVTVTNEAGCTASAAKNISVSAPATATITGAASVCGNANVVLTATTAGVSYSWTGPGGFVATTAAISTPAVAGQYKVTVTNAAGCISTAMKTVSVTAAPTATISGNVNICAGTTLLLIASGGNSYSWSGPGGYTKTGSILSRPGVFVSMSGNYTVTVTGNGGCVAIANIDVIIATCKMPDDVNSLELTAYPNPTGGLTTIAFTSVEAEHVSLSVFNTEGKEVATLFNGQTESLTNYEFELDLSLLPSGIYYAVLHPANGQIQRIKLMVVR